MVAYSSLFAWVLSAIGALPLVERTVPHLALLHEKLSEFYRGLDKRQHTLLCWALALTAYGPLSIAYYVGVSLLMPFLCAALLATGAIVNTATRQFALQQLAKVLPCIVPLVERCCQQLDEKAELANILSVGIVVDEEKLRADQIDSDDEKHVEHEEAESDVGLF